MVFDMQVNHRRPINLTGGSRCLLRRNAGFQKSRPNRRIRLKDSSQRAPGDRTNARLEENFPKRASFRIAYAHLLHQSRWQNGSPASVAPNWRRQRGFFRPEFTRSGPPDPQRDSVKTRKARRGPALLALRLGLWCARELASAGAAFDLVAAGQGEIYV